MADKLCKGVVSVSLSGKESSYPNETESVDGVPEEVQDDVQSAETEEWRPVVGYEGIYLVSNQGRVQSLDRTVNQKNGSRRSIKGRMLIPSTLATGYPRVKLWRNGTGKEVSIHRLVVEAFVGDPDGFHVNHKDGDRENNDVTNLEIVTPRQNFRHAMEIGLWDYRGTKHHWSKISDADVRVIRKLYAYKHMTQDRIANMFGIIPSTVHCVKSYKSWRHIDENLPLWTFRGVPEGSTQFFIDDLAESSEVVYTSLRTGAPNLRCFKVHVIVPGDVFAFDVQVGRGGIVRVPQIEGHENDHLLRPLPDEDSELYQLRCAVCRAVVELGAGGVYGVPESVLPSLYDDEEVQHLVLSISGYLYQEVRSGTTSGIN